MLRENFIVCEDHLPLATDGILGNDVLLKNKMCLSYPQEAMKLGEVTTEIFPTETMNVEEEQEPKYFTRYFVRSSHGKLPPDSLKSIVQQHVCPPKPAPRRAPLQASIQRQFPEAPSIGPLVRKQTRLGGGEDCTRTKA